MKCKFVVGQKIVCVEDTSNWPAYGNNDKTVPAVGGIYTILCIDVWDDVIYVGLEELPFLMTEYTAFKPLDECKTDISVFTKLLNTKQKELVE